METRKIYRRSLGLFFFLSGLSFSTWASRIPSIKMNFDLNEAELGNLLLSMPVSSLIGLPLSGWLVSKFDSRIPLSVAFLSMGLALALIGLATDLWALVAAISLFSFSMRIANISMNTQSITLQKTYARKIMGSFHGLWSTGGLAGVALSTLLIKFDIPMQEHLLSVGVLVCLLSLLSYRYLLSNDRSPSGNVLNLRKPDRFIVMLGLIIFLAALCEGGMFDWSGVYFREVVGEEVFTLGYFIFMIFMAASRFFSDRLVEWVGMKRMYFISSGLIMCGILLMIVFPLFWPALLGFSLVGVGVAAVIPMTFSLAGNSEKYSAGMVISILATYSIVGMLLGPPLVGYVAHLFNLRIAFVLFFLSGLLLIPISHLFFRNFKTD